MEMNGVANMIIGMVQGSMINHPIEILIRGVNMKYGQGDDESIITEYLDSHLEEGIKQKNLDLILDLIDDYVELIEEIER